MRPLDTRLTLCLTAAVIFLLAASPIHAGEPIDLYDQVIATDYDCYPCPPCPPCDEAYTAHHADRPGTPGASSAPDAGKEPGPDPYADEDYIDSFARRLLEARPVDWGCHHKALACISTTPGFAPASACTTTTSAALTNRPRRVLVSNDRCTRRSRPPFVGGDPGANEVDFEELSTYVEFAFSPRFSVFGEFPVRWVSDVNFGGAPGFEDGEQGGAGDFKAGFRLGIIACPYELLTFQLRPWTPTGEALRAIGVGHDSIDVALLYTFKPDNRTTWFAELQDWQTLDAGTTNDVIEQVDLDGNILRYGLGVGYDVWQSNTYCYSDQRALTAIFEVVGWTVLDGVITPLFVTDGATIEDAEGDTIVNGKYGMRIHGLSEHRHSYGHNWTGDRWYSDLFRVEWQWNY